MCCFNHQRSWWVIDDLLRLPLPEIGDCVRISSAVQTPFDLTFDTSLSKDTWNALEDLQMKIWRRERRNRKEILK